MVHRFTLAIIVLATACRGGSDGPSCSVVAGQFFKVATDALTAATLDDTTRRQVHDQLPAMRDSFDQVCTDGAWSRPVRDCLAKAADHLAIEACERQLTDAQKAALDHATRGDAPKSP